MRDVRIILNFDRWKKYNFAGRNRDKDNIAGRS